MHPIDRGAIVSSIQLPGAAAQCSCRGEIWWILLLANVLIGGPRLGDAGEGQLTGEMTLGQLARTTRL